LMMTRTVEKTVMWMCQVGKPVTKKDLQRFQTRSTAVVKMISLLHDMGFVKTINCHAFDVYELTEEGKKFAERLRLRKVVDSGAATRTSG